MAQRHEASIALELGRPRSMRSTLQSLTRTKTTGGGSNFHNLGRYSNERMDPSWTA